MSALFGAVAVGLCALAAAPVLAQTANRPDAFTVKIGIKDVWPPAPVTDLVGLPGAEGQMLLEWTAPDSNNNVFPTDLRSVSGYLIRIATFSVDSVGGSTTAWWSAANDVRSLPAPAVSAAPPTPGAPGVTDSLLITGLEPGATMYAMIKSSDTAGFYSDADTKSTTPGDQAFALVYDAAPPTPTNLNVFQTGGSTFTITWSTTAVADLDYYKVYIDSTVPYDFGDYFLSTTAPAGSTSTKVGGLFLGAYAFRITAVDKGAPTYLGHALESAASGIATAELTVEPAQTPFGFILSTGPTTATMTWFPVVRYSAGTAFADPNSPTADELTGYRIYRSTTPILANWSMMADVSTATWSWTDNASGPQYYYGVKSERNDAALSPMSLIISAATLDAFSVAPDDQSYFRIPKAAAAPLIGTGDPNTAYAVVASSHPEDLGGRVFKSIEFKALRGGDTVDPSFELSSMGTLYMHYAISGSSLTPSFGGTAAAPENASVYWWNGNKWLQLYGDLRTSTQEMALETKYFGKYQLRVVERAASFAFNVAGLSNRFVTPNGDGKNDTVVFTYDNPRDVHVKGRILDLRGRVVKSDLPMGPLANSLVWDGKGVPGGVYIYQLDGDGQSFTGTIVILK